jgi:hypothetical protein
MVTGSPGQAEVKPGDDTHLEAVILLLKQLFFAMSLRKAPVFGSLIAKNKGNIAKEEQQCPH